MNDLELLLSAEGDLCNGMSAGMRAPSHRIHCIERLFIGYG